MSHINLRALMIGLMIVGLSSLAQATSFIIELHNGHEVSTPHVWEEGDEVKFFMAHGTAGIPKALVKRVTTVPRISHNNPARPAIPPHPGNPGSAAGHARAEMSSPTDAARPSDAGQRAADEASQSAGPQRLTTGDPNLDRAEKVRLTRQLDDATRRYREAADVGNLAAKQTALAAMRTSRKQIRELSDAVKQKHAGQLPSWWNE